jgi:hypothetical protein
MGAASGKLGIGSQSANLPGNQEGFLIKLRHSFPEAITCRTWLLTGGRKDGMIEDILYP